MKGLLCAGEALSFPLSVFHRRSFFFLLSYPVFPGSIHILSAPGIFYGKKCQLSSRWGRSCIYYSNRARLDQSGVGPSARRRINYAGSSGAADILCVCSTEMS